MTQHGVQVALNSQGVVIGCIDIRLPVSMSGRRTIGVPEGDTDACYILNVVVAEQHRGQHVGTALMQEAMRRAVTVWHAQRLYTSVEADNEVRRGAGQTDTKHNYSA